MAKFKAEKNVIYSFDSKYSVRREGMRDQLEWIRRQLEYASFSEKLSLRYDLKKGEIYEFDWGINVNAEFSNRHYGVVLIDSDIYNPLVTVCPLKSKHQGAHPKSDVDLGRIDGLNSENETVAVVNQIRTMDKLRIYMKRAIGTKIETLNDSTFENENTIIRLENSKLNRIIEAYKRYLLGYSVNIVEQPNQQQISTFWCGKRPFENVEKSTSKMCKTVKSHFCKIDKV